jgi:threonine dehydratase
MATAAEATVTARDVERAEDVVGRHVRRTPMVRAGELSRR